MLNKRTSGVLLPLSSVNGEFGIGVMGEEAKTFIKKIKRMGFHYWQLLPVGHTDEMNSPYCSLSAFAGNFIYIDPRALFNKGLISKETLSRNIYPGSQYTADYSFAQKNRLAALKEAFSNLSDEEKIKVNEFAKEYDFVSDYSLYMALKEAHGYLPWWKWKTDCKFYEKAVLLKDSLKDEILFWSYTQYEFYSQWFALKDFAKENGINLLGDMPIYVSLDSVDVWSKRHLFELDKETLKPKKVAGVPPDYFSENGQKWGNPIYNWAEMEKSGYSWWIDRLSFALKVYDTVRIDHFRAFASYWEVDFEAETAKEGEWKKGPGMKLFDAVNQKIKNASIVAEDLGTFGEDVVKLLEDTNFPGMCVIQFGFDPMGDSTHLPHNYNKNSVAYVGTHDNNTVLGWLYDATPGERQFALDYCGFSHGDWGEGGYKSRSCRSIIETVWRSPSLLSIVAFQDMCGFGCDARMNTPGTCEGNWLYRAGKDAMDNIDEEYFLKINNLYKRN